MLAVMYLQGRGVSKDLVEAYRWFRRSEIALPPSHFREQAARAIRLLDAHLTPAQTEAVRYLALDGRFLFRSDVFERVSLSVGVTGLYPIPRCRAVTAQSEVRSPKQGI